MADADITLDGGNAIVDGNWLLVRCLDIKLDAPSRRSSTAGERRALVHGFSDELVVNYADDYPGGVTVRGEVKFTGKIKQNHLRLESHDLHLNHPDRRSTATGNRRALVHGFNDELVLNWAKDYPGGVAVHGNLEVQKSGRLRLRNNAGNTVAEIDSNGNIFLGGNGTDGDLVCKDSDGKTIIHIDAQNNSMNFYDTSGALKVRIDSDQYSTSSWPAWPGESVPTTLELITEMRRLKEEVVALRAEVDALSP
jgi:hypothetical protein